MRPEATGATPTPDLIIAEVRTVRRSLRGRDEPWNIALRKCAAAELSTLKRMKKEGGSEEELLSQALTWYTHYTIHLSNTINA